MEKDRLESDIDGKFRALWRLVGETPMIEIFYSYHGDKRSIFAKCENYNLTGSIKDRIALHILHKAYQNNAIQPGDTIIEATSGNTGIAFASIGRMLGHYVKIIMPDWMSKERRDIVKSLGAEIIQVTRAEGGFIRSIQMCEELAAENKNVFLPRQFSNFDNPEVHENTTAMESWVQMTQEGYSIDAFVAGVGTGGTVMGFNRFLKKKDSLIIVHPLEPAESPTLSTGKKNGVHRIQGISDEFIPEILNLNLLDPVLKVNDGDAIIMAQKLASEAGLLVGISSGANFIGAVKHQNEYGSNRKVVTVFSDSNSKYLSTSLMNKEPVQDFFLSKDIKILGYRSMCSPRNSLQLNSNLVL